MVITVLQVQKGAPVGLLLGTDILSHLGFKFSRLEKDEELTDLLVKAKSGLSTLVTKGVTMSDGLVDAEKTVTLVIRNQGVEPVLLEEGKVIGHLQSN